jgi:integrase
MENVVPNVVPEKIPSIHITLSTNKADREGREIVYLVLYVSRKKVLFNTGVKVEPDLWDHKAKKIRKEHPNASDFNLIIKNAESRLTNALVKFKLQNRQILPKALKDEYSRPSQDVDFLEFMGNEITRRDAELTETTAKHHRSHLNKLKEFKKVVTFAELDEDFFQELNKWMKVKKKNGANTRHSTLKTIRTYVNIARRKGIIKHNPFQRMPVKKTIPDRVFLEPEELESLKKRYLKETLRSKHQKVLRHFLFGCYTGLRISDIRSISMEDIFGNMLVLVPHKTKNINAKTVKIPLTKTAMMLIKDESPYRLNGHVFSCFSEQKMRDYIKEVAKMVEIDKNINFHTARHTFATLFLRKTKNLIGLQKILGHQSVTQTMIYSHIITDDLISDMEDFDS